MAEKEYIEREALRDTLYEADAITMRGVAILNQFPAADVRPVGCGRWELSDETPYIRKHYHPVACSNCHRAGMKGWNYCPNCGADMREES